MHKATSTLLSIGVAIVGTKLASALTDLEFHDILKPLGLSRRRSHWPANLAYLGAGIVVGGVTALLVAPSSGQATRERLAKAMDERGEAASKKYREPGTEAHGERFSGRSNGDKTQSSVPV